MSRHKYWGKHAAGIIAMSVATRRFLVALRSSQVRSPNTWGTIGGKIDDGETPLDGAIREFVEETDCAEDVSPDSIALLYTFKDGSFTYHTFLLLLHDECYPVPNWETKRFAWVTLDELLDLKPKHHGLKEMLSSPDVVAELQNVTEA